MRKHVGLGVVVGCISLAWMAGCPSPDTGRDITSAGGQDGGIGGVDASAGRGGGGGIDAGAGGGGTAGTSGTGGVGGSGGIGGAGGVGGTSGHGGSGGTGGTTGTGGIAGSSGAGGITDSGAGGDGGLAGAAGDGGTAGAGGGSGAGAGGMTSGGSGGAAGIGSGGTAGDSGGAGTAGTGGSSAGGTAGFAGSGGGSGGACGAGGSSGTGCTLDGGTSDGGMPTCIVADEFDGTTVDPCNWHIPVHVGDGDGTFLGQTQFRCCPASLPEAQNSGAVIRLETYDPNGGGVFYGTDLIGNSVLTLGQGITYTVRAKMDTPTQGGIVHGIFLYSNPTDGLGNHDEIDFEILSNHPDLVYMNVYDNQNGAGKLVSMPFPSGGVATDYHVYEIRWLPTRVLWYVDGIQYREETVDVPQGPMYPHLNIWVPSGPGTPGSFPAAYDAGFLPATNAGQNQVFSMSVDSVVIAASK